MAAKAALALRAAEIIGERGSCKHRPEDSEGRVCLYRALTEALKEAGMAEEYPNLEDLLVVQEMEEILRERGDRDWRSLSVWQDRDDITGEDVILLFKEAAGRLGS